MSNFYLKDQPEDKIGVPFSGPHGERFVFTSKAFELWRERVHFPMTTATDCIRYGSTKQVYDERLNRLTKYIFYPPEKALFLSVLNGHGIYVIVNVCNCWGEHQWNPESHPIRNGEKRSWPHASQAGS